ncbi:MAG: FHA domain-containing protein [Planctomycetota bacterium]
MRVKLRVLKGAQAGREVAISVSKFLIGRGEECHLRPRSDAISRQHCAILIKDGQVIVRDLGSKNGSYVNGQRVEGARIVRAGDEFQVGPLQFEIVIEQAIGGAKRPAAQDVKEVASRTAASPADDLDVASWLEEGEDTDASRAVATPETRQFRVQDTNNLALDTNIEGQPQHDAGQQGQKGNGAGQESKEGADAQEKRSARSDKGAPGKLPKRPSTLAEDSRQAAADMLKRFFNR